MTERMCLYCGVVDVSKRRGKALFCLSCARKAAGRNGAKEAHRAVRKEITAKRLKPASELVCVDCGDQALDYDHRDYNKPLDVQPVCRRCNKLRGPAIPLLGVGLFTSKQSKFVAPNWTVKLTPTPSPATNQAEA